MRAINFKVIFIPDGREGNPYQKALANSLSKEGVYVHFGTTSYLFSVLRSVRNCWKSDILHLHWTHLFTLASTREETIIKSVSFIGELLILKLFGIRIIWTVHNIVSHEAKFPSLELFFNQLIAWLCDKIIVHSPSAKNEVINMYKARKFLIEIITHGNYIGCYENVISKLQARKQLQLNTKDTVFLYFGKIRPYKGMPELIGAFKKLNCKKVKLLMVGKPLNDKVAADILNRCKQIENINTIFEFIPDDEIQIYMNAADIVVLPYRDILTSGAAILAISFGKPVIAPSIGCIPDVLDSEGSFLYKPSEREDLLKAMKQAFNADLKKMGKHNFKLAKQLQWEEIAKKTYYVYQKSLKRKRGD